MAEQSKDRERVDPERLDQGRRRELEDERDFLMRSLDDLELEHESGGIDDESYAELHDDYTARAAAVIRTLRDGVDVTPPRAPTSRNQTRRRIVLVAAVLVFALVAGTSLAYALGARLPGQTSTGNSAAAPSTTNATGHALAQKIDDLQKQVNASPNDYDLRLQLADAYANNADLPTAIKQWDAAITIDGSRPEAHALIGRALYLVSEQIADKSSQQQTVAESLAAEDKAIENDPEYADAYFYRGVILAGIKQYSASQADLQLYIVKAPDGTWTNQAHSLLAQVTTALETPSTTVPPTSTTRKKK
ncbi:MAG TPA: tetratricopeptide repeat protein [Acidimicrobiia bacterium]|jgi:cytochrome c-type biogenesis protein CcmH/NrfG|nr:tetratricopeptide repeat protein [Acidimicrobiia bacterium]